MNRMRRALVAGLFLCFTTFAYTQAQDSGQQPDPAKQQELKRKPDAVPPQKSPEPNSSPEARPKEEQPRKSEKQETPKPPKDQPKPAQEEHGRATGQGQVNTAGKSAHIPDPKVQG